MLLRRIFLILAIAMIALSAAAVRAAGPTSNPSSAIEREMIRRSDANNKSPTSQESGVNLRGGAGSSLDIQRVTLSLMLVIGVIIAARFAMKKLFPAVAVGRNSQVIRVLSRSVVGPKQQFLLVQIGKRLVLVGDSGASMNALSQIDDADEVAALIGKLQSESSNSATGAFASFFRKAGSEFKIEDETALARREELDKDMQVADSPPREAEGELATASNEISGLMDRVRLLTKRMRQT